MQDFLSLAAFLLAWQPREPQQMPLEGAQPSLRAPAGPKSVFVQTYVHTHTHTNGMYIHTCFKIKAEPRTLSPFALLQNAPELAAEGNTAHPARPPCEQHPQQHQEQLGTTTAIWPGHQHPHSHRDLFSFSCSPQNQAVAWRYHIVGEGDPERPMAHEQHVSPSPVQGVRPRFSPRVFPAAEKWLPGSLLSLQREYFPAPCLPCYSGTRDGNGTESPELLAQEPSTQ